MVAAEDDHSGASIHTRPHLPPQGKNPSPNPPYPLSDLPPTCTPLADFDRPQSPDYHRSRPVKEPCQPLSCPSYPPHLNVSQPPREKRTRRPAPYLDSNTYQPLDSGGLFTTQSSQPQQKQQQQRFPYQQLHHHRSFDGTPAVQPVYGHPGTYEKRPFTATGHGFTRSRSSRSRSRSRCRNRSRSREHHHKTPAQRRKPSGVSIFLGAGGGAIIGDAIFPGLGIIGGALLGGWGGHEFSRQRKEYDQSGSTKSSSSKSRRGRRF